MDADAVVGEVLEGGAEQARAEFGAADADVDDVGNCLTVKAFPLTAAHALANGFHAFAHGTDVRADVFAIDDEGLVGRRAQAVVQRRAVFASIDVVATGDGGDACGDARFIHPLLPQRFGLCVDVIFGEIEVDAGVFQCPVGDAAWLGGEPFGHAFAEDGFFVRLQFVVEVAHHGIPCVMRFRQCCPVGCGQRNVPDSSCPAPLWRGWR